MVFFDGAFNTTSVEQNNYNTWLHDNFVAVYKGELIAYFEGNWNRQVDIISGFRAINFNKKLGRLFVKALFQYFDYLFINRGCMAFNWVVAVQNEYALHQYERFVKYYCGHKVGTRTHAQKSYTGKISDINLYEITRQEYLEWKARGFTRR